jgi:hypothetical protein
VKETSAETAGAPSRSELDGDARVGTARRTAAMRLGRSGNDSAKARASNASCVERPSRSQIRRLAEVHIVDVECGLTAAVAPSNLLRLRVRATRGSALRQAFARLWNRLSILWKVVFVIATLGSALAFVLLLVALFRAEPERTLRVGDTAAWGGFDFTFRKIACHKRRRDLPKPIAERPFPIKGELCFVDFRIRNSSDDRRDTFALLSTREAFGPVLHVGDKEYEATIATPTVPAEMLPDQEAPLTVIFEMPRRVEPTALTLKDGQGEEGAEVEWEIPR